MITVNAKRAGPRATLACTGNTFSLGDRSYALADLPGMKLESGGGVALTPAGRLVPFAVRAPRLVPGVGLLLEPGVRNKVTGYSAAPINASGWTKSPSAPTTVTITVVDDTAALYAAQDPASGEFIFRELMDAGVMNGKVYRFYNPDPTTTWSVSVPGTAGATGAHSIGAYVRCISGSGDIRVFSTATSETFAGAHWRRVVRSNVVLTTGASRLSIAAAPLSEILIILPDFQSGGVITSPVVTSGAAATRADDNLAWGNLGGLLAPPFTVEVEGHIQRADNVARRLLTLRSGAGGEVTLTRGADNTLASDQTRGALRPFIPRCFGPGSVRAALRVRERGRTIAFGQALAHDPFTLAVERLKTLYVGQGAAGQERAGLWLRSLTISGDLDDDQLRSRTLPAADGVALDIFRYIDPAGNDANDGKTPATAWAGLSKGADATVPGGGHVLLKRGGVWPGGLLVKSFCTYGGYGDGPKPKFGAGVDFAVDENSASAVRIEGLHLDGSSKMGVNLFGGTGYQFGGWQVVDTEISHIGLAAGPDYQGMSFRFTRNVYLARNYVHNVYGDCVWGQSVRGLVIDEDGRYDTPLGSAADCWQASTCEMVIIRRPVMNMRTQATDSGKGALVIQATGALVEDFDIRGLNFGIGLNTSKAQVRRGVIRNGDQQSYSWGIGITESANVREHVWEDILIEDCNRGVALSGIGGGPAIGPTRIDVLARRILVRRCGVGLRVDRPTSGNLTGITYEDCGINKQLVAGLIVPVGGWYTDLKT